MIHPDYNTTVNNHQNDICLLTLDYELEFNDNVKPIGLNDENLTAGTKCTVSGWGLLQASALIVDSNLRNIKILKFSSKTLVGLLQSHPL